MILKLRTALFWTHLAIGVVAGLFILNMVVSGILMAYQKQIVALAEGGERTIAVPVNATRLDVEALISKVQKSQPQSRLSGLVVYSDPAAAAMFNVGREGNVIYANPYTGEVQGKGAKALRGFFHFITSWHRWLALGETNRPVGEAITGTVSLAYFALLLSGLILWLPRQWSRSRVRQGAVLDLKLRGKPRDWNWHNLVGLWCSPLLLLVTLTGIIMSHQWASNLLFQLTGNPPQAHRQGDDSDEAGNDNHGARHGTGHVAPFDATGINPLWVQAEKQVPGWHSISLRFSGSPDAPATFLIDRGDGSRPDTIARLSLDRDTGDIVRWQPYETQNAGQKLRAWVRPLHTGQAGGVLGESVAVIAALGGITLVLTGLSMALRRFFGRKQQPVSSSSLPQIQPNPSPL